MAIPFHPTPGSGRDARNREIARLVGFMSKYQGDIFDNLAFLENTLIKAESNVRKGGAVGVTWWPTMAATRTIMDMMAKGTLPTLTRIDTI